MFKGGVWMRGEVMCVFKGGVWVRGGVMCRFKGGVGVYTFIICAWEYIEIFPFANTVYSLVTHL